MKNSQENQYCGDRAAASLLTSALADLTLTARK